MHCPRRALCALLLALALASAGAAAAKAPAAGGRPSEPLFDADALRALSARLEEMARDVERALASNSSSAAAAAKLEYLQDALHTSLDAVSDLGDVSQLRPSVHLHWRILWRGLWVTVQASCGAALDFFGALFIFGSLTGKFYAYQYAADDTVRFVNGMAGAVSDSLVHMPWSWRAFAAPPLILCSVVLPAVLIFITFSLKRLLVIDRALLGVTVVVTAARMLLGLAAPYHALPVTLPATLGRYFWTAARAASSLLFAKLILRLRELKV